MAKALTMKLKEANMKVYGIKMRERKELIMIQKEGNMKVIGVMGSVMEKAVMLIIGV